MALSNKEIPTDLREYIEINILPQYATFDKAHRLNHAEKVIEESMKLAQYYEVEPAMVFWQPTKNYGNGLVKHNYKP